MAGKSKKYLARFDGQTFTRVTDRTYSHVVIGRNAGKDWYPTAWVGREDLVEAACRRARKIFSEVRAIPVEERF